MALSTSIATIEYTKLSTQLPFHSSKTALPFSVSVFNVNPPILGSIICSAAKQRSGSVKSSKKRKKKGGSSLKENSLGFGDVEIVKEKNRLPVEEFEDQFEDDGREDGGGEDDLHLPLPKPPAGFVVDDEGKVVMASSKRIVTVIDPTNNLPLECTIRRIFTSSRGEECMLLCPVDMPVEIVKSTSEGWAAVTDEEIEGIRPTADYALAKIHMHLVDSGFCFTARGGFCYSPDSIFKFQPDGKADGPLTEGVEITCFHLDGSHYMMYTPTDPLLFVATKDEDGQLRILDDDLMDDPAIISGVDEEIEFNALVEEEMALLESLLGET